MKIGLVKFDRMTDKDKVQLALLIAGIVVLAVIIGFNYFAGGKKTRRPKIEEEKQEIVANEKQGARQAVPLYPKKTMPEEIAELVKNAGRSDPFLRPEKQASTLGFGGADIKLSGIVSDGTKPFAIINGEMVAEGGMVGNKKIVKIKEKSVIVSENEVETEITMGGFE